MVIFFLTLAYPIDIKQRNLYTDLMDELASRGHDVTVFIPRKKVMKGKIESRGAIHIESVNTGKIAKTAVFKKAVNTLLIESRYISAIKRVISKKNPDLLIYSTPPITFLGAVVYTKSHTNCQTYLLLKDIFPANACDLGLIKYGSPIWMYFRCIEKRLYNVSDRIGCMSQANVKYLLTHNKDINEKKVEICSNSIYPTENTNIPVPNLLLLKEYKIPQAPFKMIYGGNLGRSQCVPFIIDVLEEARRSQRDDLFFVIIGDGTDYGLLRHYISKTNNPYVCLLNKLPRNEYLKLLASMDAGLVFLDNRFTIPNVPSRILEYMDFSLPILAATDEVTDIREMLEGERCGLWSRSGDVGAFFFNIDMLRRNSKERLAKGMRGREVLVNRFSVHASANIILKNS